MTSKKKHGWKLPWKAVRFIGTLATVGIFAYVVTAFDSHYAQWETGEMLIEYLEDHNDQWPREWKDLEPYYDSNHSRVSGWSFNELRRSVWIDFDADVKALQAAAVTSKQATFDVVGQRFLFINLAGDYANQMLNGYFRRRLPSPPKAPKPGGPIIITK